MIELTRVILVLALGPLVLTAALCDYGIGITIVNQSSSPVCFYASDNYDHGDKRPDPADPDEDCTHVDPNETLGPIDVLCTDNDTKWVVLTPGFDGEEIYARSATCQEWEGSGATVTVTKTGDEFVVTDSLPDP